MQQTEIETDPFFLTSSGSIEPAIPGLPPLSGGGVDAAVGAHAAGVARLFLLPAAALDRLAGEVGAGEAPGLGVGQAPGLGRVADDDVFGAGHRRLFAPAGGRLRLLFVLGGGRGEDDGAGAGDELGHEGELSLTLGW